jgi:hypothetical protein
MPLNNVEELLSGAADLIEASLADDADLCKSVNALITTGQTPFVVRILNALPGGAVRITISSEEKAIA